MSDKEAQSAARAAAAQANAPNTMAVLNGYDSPQTQTKKASVKSHPWSPSSRPRRTLTFDLEEPPAAPAPQPAPELPPEGVEQWYKERYNAPYAKKYLGEGFSRDKHMKAIASKVACDLRDARSEPFEGHSYSMHLREEYERIGRVAALPGSINHSEWNDKQLPFEW